MSCTKITSGFTGQLNATYQGNGNGGGGGSSSGGGAGAGGGEGKVLGGLMTVTRLSDGLVLGSAVTDGSQGLVTIVPCASDLPVLLTLSGQAGAQYYDEGLGKLAPFPAGTALHALVDVFDENVGVSFLTEGAYQYALNNMAPSPGSLIGLTTAQVQLANTKILAAINAKLPTTTLLTTLKSLPQPIDGNSAVNALLGDRYGIAEAVSGGLVFNAATNQPGSSTPALGFGAQLDADLSDGVIDGLSIGGLPVASSSSAYYTALGLSGTALSGMVSVTNKFATPTILPLLLPTISISASSFVLNPGQSTTITWTTGNATSCTASDNWSGNQALSGTSSYTATLTGSVSYTLTCTGPAGSSSNGVTVYTIAPPTVGVSTCGSATYGPATVTAPPASTLCSTGSSPNTTDVPNDENYWYWTCTAPGAQATQCAQQWAPATPNCGSANNGPATSIAPEASTLCQVGSTPNTTTVPNNANYWYWTCSTPGTPEPTACAEQWQAP